MKRNNSDANIVKKSASTTFKYNNIDDKKIYESLDKVIDKSQFIKNALYYYIIMIESGKAIDRNLPQENNKKEDNLSTFIELLAKQQVVNNNENGNHNEDEENQNIDNTIDEESSNNDEDNINDLEDDESKIEIPSELLKAEEDDFNF